MKLERFKEKNNKKKFIIIFTVCCILLLAGVFLYTSFAVFTEEKQFNVINGTYQDPGDIYFAIYIDDKIVQELPSKTAGYVFDTEKSTCTNNVGISWNHDDWHADLDFSNYQVESMGRTKCTVYFKSVSTYNITYDLNDGLGIVNNQTKLAGIDLKLTEETPTKENYTFVGWSTTKDGPVEYKSGETFSRDESTTLYAQYGLNYVYHEGNQFVSDTGGWTYTSSMSDENRGETYDFTDTYIEWSEVVTTSTDGYGDGYFETINYVNLKHADSINFVYDVSNIMGAFVTVDDNYRYPFITFRVVDKNNNILVYETLAFAYMTSSPQIYSLNLKGIDTSSVKIIVRCNTASTQLQTMTFRLYSVYATY